jgi:hypothetical protein
MHSVKVLLTLFLFVISVYKEMHAQIVPELTAGLEDDLSEASGIALKNDTLWMINDGGNPSQLFLYNITGNFLGKVNLPDLMNRDWEAIQWQGDSVLWIADIGNNANNRRDLKFYKIWNLKTANGQWTYQKDSLVFAYQNQSLYPPVQRDLHFDCESFVIKEDSILLFTKNRSNPYNGMVYMHYLPAQSGNYNTALVDSLFTGNGPKEIDWITDASLNGNSLWLLSHGYTLRFDSFHEKRFAQKRNYTFSAFSQKEGIAYRLPYIFVADESNSFFSGKNVYRYLMDSMSDIQIREAFYKINVKNRHLNIATQSDAEVLMYDLAGKELNKQHIKEGKLTSFALLELPQTFIVILRSNNLTYRQKIFNPCLK